jgi:hypothetical protein
VQRDERRRTCQRSQPHTAVRTGEKEEAALLSSYLHLSDNFPYQPRLLGVQIPCKIRSLGTRSCRIFTTLGDFAGTSNGSMSMKCSAVLGSSTWTYVKVCIDRPGVIIFPCTDRGYDKAFKFCTEGSMHGWCLRCVCGIRPGPPLTTGEEGGKLGTC